MKGAFIERTQKALATQLIEELLAFPPLGGHWFWDTPPHQPGQLLRNHINMVGGLHLHPINPQNGYMATSKFAFFPAIGGKTPVGRMECPAVVFQGYAGPGPKQVEHYMIAAEESFFTLSEINPVIHLRFGKTISTQLSRQR